MPGPEDTENLVRYLVTSLVDDAEAVDVTRKDDDDSTVITIAVAPDDTGKVIGRQGRIIKAIRVLARATGCTGSHEVDVEVLG
ncbi:MAG: KH domain-containing protein [Actinobacteria bacterium]|nr:MAG: KH domain-containing protein [Actinomycetota bacterium]